MSEERFQLNLKRWSLFSPEAAQELSKIDPNDVVFCKAENGSSNLRLTIEGQSYDFHSQIDPIAEAKEWVKRLNLKDKQVLYVYGVGQGYLFDALEEWLQNPDHFLAFLEDRLSVIRRLLETERGTRILHHPQVWLFFFENSTSNLSRLCEMFPVQSFQVEAADLYQRMYPKQVHELKSHIGFLSSLYYNQVYEYKLYGLPFFQNYFRNLFYWSRSHVGNSLFGSFEGVPAIICGAGPSLDKNYDVLAKLSDRALIFAGATAMNAINAKGIVPHFGVGIDPNNEQMSRIIMNIAYETPFFYRNRMNHEALGLIHGDRLMISGSSGYDIASYIETKLGADDLITIDEGMNVVNFNLSIAKALKCSPIIFVGLDLAYTNNQSYASGLQHHPIHTRSKHFRTKSQSDELLLKNDIFGNPVSTLWKWIDESLWYANSFIVNPVKLINATEGGIGLPFIPNMPLAEAAEKMLTKQYDFDSHVHGAIYNTPFISSASEEHVFSILNELAESMKTCSQLLNSLQEEYTQLLQHNADIEPVPDDWENEAINGLQKKLKQEIAFTSMLKRFEEAFNTERKREFNRIELDKDLFTPREIRRRRLTLDQQRLSFLQNAASRQEALLRVVIFEEKQKAQQRQAQEAIAISKINPPVIPQAAGTVYSYENHILTIIDPEFNLNYKEEFTPDPGEGSLYYENGSPKLLSHYKGGKLHGPSSAYSQDGKLLSQSWYIDGVRQGKSIFYYPSGALHSIRRKKDGVSEGRQEYFYENGGVRAVVPYWKGRLHGEILLYHPTGKQARELHFIDGKRQGVDRIWNSEGNLIIEAQFEDDKPTGTARVWYDNGNLAQESVYDDVTNSCKVSLWNEHGFPIIEQADSSEDYFENITKQTGVVTKSLTDVFRQINLIVPLIAEMADVGKDTAEMKSYQQDLVEVSKAIENLQEMNSKIAAEAGIDLQDRNEDVWKTLKLEKEMRRQLEGFSQKINTDINNLHATLKKTLEELAKKRKKDEIDS